MSTAPRAWIQELNKAEISQRLGQYGLDTSGIIDDLRHLRRFVTENPGLFITQPTNRRVLSPPRVPTIIRRDQPEHEGTRGPTNSAVFRNGGTPGHHGVHHRAATARPLVTGVQPQPRGAARRCRHLKEIGEPADIATAELRTWNRPPKEGPQDPTRAVGVGRPGEKTSSRRATWHQSLDQRTTRHHALHITLRAYDHDPRSTDHHNTIGARHAHLGRGDPVASAPPITQGRPLIVSDELFGGRIRIARVLPNRQEEELPTQGPALRPPVPVILPTGEGWEVPYFSVMLSRKFRLRTLRGRWSLRFDHQGRLRSANHITGGSVFSDQSSRISLGRVSEESFRKSLFRSCFPRSVTEYLQRSSRESKTGIPPHIPQREGVVDVGTSCTSAEVPASETITAETPSWETEAASMPPVVSLEGMEMRRPKEA
ncbi:hypothetical protein EAI_01404 [Harpegnathos saltator]|uniref:Uncharacterized protein n=1 Tax=Harpegnathos saltator TaxID=610380 RepID=E2B739_HARSA|nr:hypothetical protein EAI_01404 [Harpegnathos saltator]